MRRSLGDKLSALWLSEGDRDTKLFHRMANARRRVNFINSIRTSLAVTSNPRAIKEETTSYFEKLYQGRWLF